MPPILKHLQSFLFLSFVANLAHAQYVWGPQDLVKLRDYKIEHIQIPVGSGNFAKNHHVAVVDSINSVTPVSESQVLDEIFRRCTESGASNCNEVNWRPTGRVWDVFKVGTPDTVAVVRFYVPTINSHVFISTNEFTGGESTLTVLRRFSNIYIEEGEVFAVKSPLAGYLEGKLPLSQACGGEAQSGLTAMLRVYNNGIAKPTQPLSTQLAVRFNDGNHLFTTRNDAGFIADLRGIPGWEIALRDSESSNRRGGVWCVPAQAKNIIQSTEYSSIPLSILHPPLFQARSFDLSKFTLNGFDLSVAANYAPTYYAGSIADAATETGLLSTNSNRATLILSRTIGGYAEYSEQGGTITRNVFPKQPLLVDSGWYGTKIDEETGIVYAMSAAGTTARLHAYSPNSNSYLWQYTIPQSHQPYRADGTELHLAGNYLIAYLQNTGALNSFKASILVIPLDATGTPDVRIIELPGAARFPVDFSYDHKNHIGIFSDALAQDLIHLDFRNWSIAVEALPFQPYAVLVSNATDEVYATEVPRTSSVTLFSAANSNLWKRRISGENWVRVNDAGRIASDISLININGTQKIMIFNRENSSSSASQAINFVDLKTGTKSPPLQIFGLATYRAGLALTTVRQ